MWHDDAEFAPGVKPGTRASILSQYDAEEKVGPQLLLGEGGEISSSLIGTDETSSAKPAPVHSLKVELKDMGDFYSRKEYAEFNKPKTKEKKLRKIRKKEIEEAESKNLDDILIDTNSLDQDEGLDRGSRKAGIGGVKTAETLSLEEARKKASYDEALRKAELKTVAAFSSAKKETYVEEDDADIAQSLARARRLAVQQKMKALAAEKSENRPRGVGFAGGDDVGERDAGAETANELLRQQQALLEQQAKKHSSSLNGGVGESKGDEDMDIDMDGSSSTHEGHIFGRLPYKQKQVDEFESVMGDEIDAEGRRADGTLVFTSTTEFTARLQAQLNEKARSRAEAALSAATRNSETEKPMKKVQGSETTAMDVNSDSSDDEGNNDEFDGRGGKNNGAEDDDDDSDDSQMGFLHRQPLVASGMAATLALLKGSGELKATADLVGRAKDDRRADPSAPLTGDTSKSLIEYRDQFGKKITQKRGI